MSGQEVLQETIDYLVNRFVFSGVRLEIDNDTYFNTFSRYIDCNISFNGREITALLTPLGKSLCVEETNLPANQVNLSRRVFVPYDGMKYTKLASIFRIEITYLEKHIIHYCRRHFYQEHPHLCRRTVKRHKPEQHSLLEERMLRKAS